MMTAASFLYVMLLFIEKVIVLNLPNYARILRYLARSVFTALLVVLSLSRMYFATHFLHQCIIGATMGICVSETVIFTKFTNKAESMNKRQWFKVGCTMAAIVASIFWLHKLISGNPMASVQLVCV
jgi:membrane-associated phospholipid phosphatase